jgi:riboflavin kinase/FMN adenylyltransferase
LFDFNGDLYGRALDVAFIAFIRDELKFSGADALVKQMDDDTARARAALKAAPDAFPRLGEVG